MSDTQTPPPSASPAPSKDKPSQHRLLYHHWLSPGCRLVRLMLAEKGLAFDLALERTWERSHSFLRLNPAGEVPVLREPDGTLLCGANVIQEYLEEVYPERPLLGPTAKARAETRRLVAWFTEKFDREVTQNLVYEKLLRALFREGAPHADSIRAGAANIATHMAYIGWLTDRHSWLAGDDFSLADIAAGAHLSCVDYIGAVPWTAHPGAKEWYMRIKSRPSFRGLLGDHVTGHPPVRDYANLDF